MFSTLCTVSISFEGRRSDKISIPSPVHTSHRTGSLSPAASSSSLASAQETIDKPKSTAATWLVEYVLKKNQNNTTEEHPIDKFLHGIAPTLKNLTRYYQNLAKTDIFNIVQKYEIIMFQQQMEVQNDDDVQIIFDTSTPSAGAQDIIYKCKKNYQKLHIQVHLQQVPQRVYKENQQRLKLYPRVF